jgi:hypothetical protein
MSEVFRWNVPHLGGLAEGPEASSQHGLVNGPAELVGEHQAEIQPLAFGPPHALEWREVLVALGRDTLERILALVLRRKLRR